MYAIKKDLSINTEKGTGKIKILERRYILPVMIISKVGR
jgi:hypothetical protein